MELHKEIEEINLFARQSGGLPEKAKAHLAERCLSEDESDLISTNFAMQTVPKVCTKVAGTRRPIVSI